MNRTQIKEIIEDRQWFILEMYATGRINTLEADGRLKELSWITRLLGKEKEA